jgi:hypothetical protein
VIDTRPPAARTDFSDLSAVDKYEMPAAEYESRTDSVLAWKKAQKLGRFNPNAPTIEQQKILASEREVEERGKLSNLSPTPCIITLSGLLKETIGACCHSSRYATYPVLWKSPQSLHLRE